MADREITWSLATQYKNGAYNGTFRFDLIQAAFDHMAQYFQVRFRRTTRGGSVLVLQATKSLGPNFAAWVTGNTIYISPTYNFGRKPELCARVILHEFGHIGGPSHSKDPDALMHLETGRSRGWIQDDMRWFGKYRLRNGLPPRGSIGAAFLPMKSGNSQVEEVTEPVACQHLDSFWSHARATYDRWLANYREPRF